MKQYPSIPKLLNTNHDIYTFDKIDGSNIRCEWTRKTKSFVKWGSRKQLLTSDQGAIANSKELISDNFLDELNRIFIDQRYDRVLSFFEVYGADSFAGNHWEGITDAVLFDVSPYKKGMLPPREFLKLFSEVDTPALLHRGKANSQLVDMVKASTLEGMTFEGVVCKGPYERKLGHPIMFKIKSRAWLDKLKNYCGNDRRLFAKLS